MLSFRTGAKFINLTLSEIAIFLTCGKTNKETMWEVIQNFISFIRQILHTLFFLVSIGVEH